MVGLLRRETKAMEPFEAFGRFDPMFENWFKWFPLHRPFVDWMPEDRIRIDEFQENGTMVIRAELPGIDPANDVELTVEKGMLHIAAHRREEEKTAEKGYVRRELHYGAFSRTLPLPEGVTESGVTAGYKDGILEIRVPLPKMEPKKKIPVTTG